MAGMERAAQVWSGERNMGHGSTIYTTCQVLLWYRSNERWIFVEKLLKESEHAEVSGGTCGNGCRAKARHLQVGKNELVKRREEEQE